MDAPEGGPAVGPRVCRAVDPWGRRCGLSAAPAAAAAATAVAVRLGDGPRRRVRRVSGTARPRPPRPGRATSRSHPSDAEGGCAEGGGRGCGGPRPPRRYTGTARGGAAQGGVGWGLWQAHARQLRWPWWFHVAGGNGMSSSATDK